ncbi:MAG: PIN domain-containing protein [Acidobacteriota bacterium]|nr:PIN domain-containing protein [Acidobacteriota bacterium]MDE2923814.1 PIN domain-containing protein [Acidobacteriota bacterium]MDE3264776.1 PIN domain-containing protein [Acidobacteriota bacterium]
MPAEFFLDTNIFVYTFDRRDPEKQARARALVEQALGTGDGVVSSQVVQEFLNVAVQKFERPLSDEQALRYLREVLDPLCSVFPSISLYETALSLHRRWRFSFYDSLILAAALESDCKVLYSEDLQDGQEIESLTVVNPF